MSTEAEDLDQWAAEKYADDPEVEFVEAPEDQNAEHASHSEAQLDRGDSLASRVRGRIQAFLQGEDR